MVPDIAPTKQSDSTNSLSRDVAQDIVLPPVLDLLAAGPLHQSLTAAMNEGRVLRVDGQEVERVSTAALQVLIAAQRSLAPVGGTMLLHAPSQALVEALGDLDLQSVLNRGGDEPCPSES